ncbi:hypothetical protein HYPSUDRAFT_201292 [Hypholoma sublateritium FD-334 SS-4]|uniref:Uncharacterized protein n=1 Tax=Hypholoma sublateritium (strain FD-334 SS-4) TaxID=945553 RepID=A0A0D2P4E7_HYPSF|nr:hypothetical protein HYPSUDRAFT_201292 [Hypholoma sublateritium FD-334 SS-4]
MPPQRPLAPPVAPRPSSSPNNQTPANPARVAALASSHSNPDDSDSEEEGEDPPFNANKPAPPPPPVFRTPQTRPAPPKAPGPAPAQTQAQPVARRPVRDRFPALNLISALLRGISANDPRCGAQVFAQVLESAHGVYDAVAAGVEELKSGKAWDAPARRALFDGWTTAASVLEEFLLALPKTYYTPSKDIALVLPPDTSTAEALDYIVSWRADREQLKKAIDKLAQQETQFLKSRVPNVGLGYTHYSPSCDKDDSIILNSLSEFYKDSTLTDEQIIQGVDKEAFVTDVKKLSKDLIESMKQPPSGRSEHTERTMLILRALMTAYIPFALIAAPHTGFAWRTYLLSAPIWTTIKSLLIKVQARDTPRAELEAQFAQADARLRTLGDVAIDTAPEMDALCNTVPSAPAPFVSRTVALVKAFDTVDAHSLLAENKSLYGHRQALKLAMRAAHTELGAIFKGAEGDVRAFAPDQRDYRERSAQLKKAFDKLAPLFVNFEIAKVWPQHEAIFKEKAENDERKMADAKAKFGV